MKDFVAKGGTVLVEPAGGDEAFAAGATDFLQSAYGVGSIRRLTPAAAVYNVAAVPDGKIDAVRYSDQDVQTRSGTERPRAPGRDAERSARDFLQPGGHFQRRAGGLPEHGGLRVRPRQRR